MHEAIRTWLRAAKKIGLKNILIKKLYRNIYGPLHRFLSKEAHKYYGKALILCSFEFGVIEIVPYFVSVCTAGKQGKKRDY
jgi:hypothetical protein